MEIKNALWVGNIFKQLNVNWMRLIEVTLDTFICFDQIIPLVN